MAAKEDSLKKVVSHAKEYGYVFPSSEIYDGLSATYDYGQYGVELKKNIREYWWKSMVHAHENIVGLDASIFMHPAVWKASGHVDAFNDPLIDNKDSKKRYRADVLLEDHMEKIRIQKIEKEIKKAAKRFGDSFDAEMFRKTNPRVLSYQEKINDIENKMRKALDDNNLEDLRDLIIDLGIVCPVSGSKNWTDVRQFNLMFITEMGSTAEDANEIYLRPETCQGIFVNFLNVQKTGRMKIPFGIAQTGKAFRNEIIARQFIFRMREFEQMEMQFFVKPGTEMKWYEYWKEARLNWHYKIGIDPENYRIHDHIKLAHYANAACDIEFDFPMGFKELEGIHSRTDFDLKSHELASGKKLQYFDPEENKNYTPYVIETSIGLDRMFLAVLSNALEDEKLEDGSERTVLKIHPALAPVKCAVLPLLKKDGLPDKAREIFSDLKLDFNMQYDEKDAIGKRYRRQDAIGTPFAVTVDHQTLEDNTVTLRDRDTMKQERIDVSTLRSVLSEKTSLRNLMN
jgi:glycyl-tRNA synthetase|tara:strand:+ start:560 stop:2098 length:1539 start_codon:yes stop_codon:yes gene_type:complete